MPSARRAHSRARAVASQLRRSNLTRSGTLTVSAQGRCSATAAISVRMDSSLRGTSSTEMRDWVAVINGQSPNRPRGSGNRGPTRRSCGCAPWPPGDLRTTTPPPADRRGRGVQVRWGTGPATATHLTRRWAAPGARRGSPRSRPRRPRPRCPRRTR
ncbi:hypothetical protein [Ornithinimicrobium kibberense]|uniref:hypothetical protein n=1 Tax=Ornithinimicrobium kibberense TaxID=282060 RepID=UPI003614E3F8